VSRDVPDPRVPKQAGYETRDADLRPLVIFLVGLTVLSLASLAVSAWLHDAFADEAETAAPHPMEAFRRPPSGPMLQSTSGVEALEARLAEAQRLETYGWIDRPNGLVHVPIQEAIESVLTLGLPVRTPQTQGDDGMDAELPRTEPSGADQPRGGEAGR
jgi:hypothetical protein